MLAAPSIEVNPRAVTLGPQTSWTLVFRWGKARSPTGRHIFRSICAFPTEGCFRSGTGNEAMRNSLDHLFLC